MVFNEKEWQKEYYLRNRVKLLIRSNKYYLRNKNTILKKRKIYGEKNKKLILKLHKNYYQKNKDKILKRVDKYYWKNRLKVLKYSKTHHPLYKKKNRLKFNLYENNRRIRKSNLLHDFTPNQWIEKVKSMNGICPVCNNQRKLTLDHTIPICKAPKGFVYTIDDVMPICKSCNTIKLGRLISYSKLKKEITKRII